MTLPEVPSLGRTDQDEIHGKSLNVVDFDADRLDWSDIDLGCKDVDGKVEAAERESIDEDCCSSPFLSHRLPISSCVGPRAEDHHSVRIGLRLELDMVPVRLLVRTCGCGNASQAR